MTRPTIQDLALAAGVSVSTVDRVLSGRNPVRQATAERVMQAAEEIGFYATNAIRHRLLANKQKRRFGFLLLQRYRNFYRNTAESLLQAARAYEDVSIQIETIFMESLTPSAVAEQILALGNKVDALGLVAAEHPLVTRALEQLRERGVPSFALVSSLSVENGIGYIGLDNWKVGRTAAWAFANLCPQGGKIGIMLGSHRFRCQELNEIGFRSYFREHHSNFQLLEAMSSAESKHLAAELVMDLLEREPDLTGLFITGGGINGAMAALRDMGRAQDLVVVGYELMDETRIGLLDGTLNLVISHPLPRMAELTIQAMLAATAEGIDRSKVSLPSLKVPFEIYTPENL
ncbi:substrate-binding domain-containing protein [uncultured Thiothrix sp.]|uniref:substrate-binding domain-containing protein n=1 Tax=uncultured Thiothrix sp. TaxID=223185 RepID=UPI00262EB2DE|nr:substrate-binding domain-containing protein [uncultured Thiothrix sp.]